jgi:hypothetical protein
MYGPLGQSVLMIKICIPFLPIMEERGYFLCPAAPPLAMWDNMLYNIKKNVWIFIDCIKRHGEICAVFRHKSLP